MKQLKKFILWLIGLALICFIGISNVFGATTKTIYSGVDSSGNLTGSNQYIYGYMTGGGTVSTSTASVNNTISGVAYGFSFSLYENTLLNNTYTLKIYFKADDLKSNFSSNMVDIKTCTTTSCNSVVIVSLEKSNPTGYSTNITIKFNPVVIGSYIQVTLGGNNQAITGVSTFGISSVTIDSENQNEDIMNNANQNANNIINNQNINTQDIIDSSSSNTQDIINNQNSNTQDIIDSQYTCKIQTITNYEGSKNVALNSSGLELNAENFVISDYIKLYSSKTYTLTKENWGASRAYCLYDNNKEIISCTAYGTSTSFSITGANYIRYTWSDTNNRTVNLYGDICLKDSEQQTNAINNLNDSINDDDIGGATQDGADFILDFDTNTFGLTSIVTAPLNLIQSLTSSTCSELELPLPFLNNKKLKLPCMTTIYQNTFGSLFTMYQTITFGIIAYWVCVRIFNQVKDFKNPEHDEIEVVDL